MQLEKSMDARFKQLKGKIQATDTDLKGKLDTRYAELKGKIGNVEATDINLQGKIDTKYTELEGKIDAGNAELKKNLSIAIQDYNVVVEGTFTIQFALTKKLLHQSLVGIKLMSIVIIYKAVVLCLIY